jgi:t-SNARE complex subunit (syntaxin)
MEKINGLYNDLNELAMEQDNKLGRLDYNIDQAHDTAKSANKQLKKAKPKSLINMRLLISALILMLVVYYFISHYLFDQTPVVNKSK